MRSVGCHLPNLCRVRVHRPKLLRSWKTSFCTRCNAVNAIYISRPLQGEAPCTQAMMLLAAQMNRMYVELTPPAPSLCCFSIRCKRALPLTFAHQVRPPTLAYTRSRTCK